MFTGDLTTEQGKQDYENYIMNNVRNEINSYTKQSQINNASSSVSGVSGSLALSVIIPSGVIVPFAGGPGVTPSPGTGQDVPDGWLLCGGAAVSRVAYSGLFTIIGTTYGVGDGSTTFNVPDLRGRVVSGKDNMGGTTASRLTAAGSGITGTTLGNSGGTETHTLTIAQMPAHGHGKSQAQSTLGTNNDVNYSVPVTGIITAYQNFQVDNTGGGGAHQNTQPSIVTNYIIKT